MLVSQTGLAFAKEELPIATAKYMTETLFNSTTGVSNTADLSTTQSSARTTSDADTVDDVFAFSLSSAISTLELNAARALEIHGATPNNNANVSARNATAETSQPSQENTTVVNSRTSSETGATTTANRQTLENGPRLNNGLSPGQQPSPTPVQTTPIATISAISPNAVNTNITAVNRQSTQATIVNPANSRLQIAKPQQTTTTPLKTQAAPQENFARLLAQRLNNGDTRFDVRLDPPELGRIDVKLLAGERSTLSLSFEQQSTLDLFRRDADALKTLLTENSFDDDGNFDIQYELASQDSESSNFQHKSFNENQPDNTSAEHLIAVPAVSLQPETSPYQHTSTLAYMHDNPPLLDIQV